jgi:hypothetical protein
MSQENVDRFLECFEVFNRLGEARETFDQELLNRWLAFFDPDIRFEPQQSVLQGSYVGPGRGHSMGSGRGRALQARLPSFRRHSRP